MKTKPNRKQIKNWLHIAVYILILLLFANYESQRKQQPERSKFYADEKQGTSLNIHSINVGKGFSPHVNR